MSNAAAESARRNDAASLRVAKRAAARFAEAARRYAGDAAAREHGQAVACAVLALCGCRPRLRAAARRWLLAAREAVCRAALKEAWEISTAILSGDADDVPEGRDGTWPQLSADEIAALPGPVECAELFLAAGDKARRAAQGFYVTPPELASFIMRGVDWSLRSEFGLAEGLLDESTWRTMLDRFGVAPPAGLRDEALDAPFVRVLDPAVGSGAFLVAAIETARSAFDESASAMSWSETAALRLLPRLAGVELMPAAAVCAYIAVAEALQGSGYDFQHDAPLRVFVGDALAPVAAQRTLLADEDADGRCELDGVRRREPFTVMVGNPPFLAAALPGHRWIEQLLKGRGPAGEAVANYYEVGGRPLAEKKLWLHDDYVKFLRYAHWRIERAGCGIVGMVTNHGYLDNATFRGLREKLLRDFPRATVVDLHGNHKKKEQPPEGCTDENVFAIEQGAAAALLRRFPAAPPGEARYAELWGTREEKLSTLGEMRLDNQSGETLAAAAPHYFLVPHDDRLAAEYRQGWSLPDAMPVNTTAPVTARDGFVVAFEQEELTARLEQFCDLAVDDDEIRARYFRGTRSVRHKAGDTRGWKLSEARRRLAGDDGWRAAVRDCLYRPFDIRSLCWSPTMIDWPRTDVMRHFDLAGNLGLIARRQMPSGEACTYFWITDHLTLDGVIRSDNRGSESIFPLLLSGDGRDSVPRPNFDLEFVQTVQLRLGLKWDPTALREKPPARETFGPRDLLAYCYALFHAPVYRARYAQLLRIEFPRLFVPRDGKLFHAMAQTGRRLIELHTLRHVPAADEVEFRLAAGATPNIAGGFPKHHGDAVRLNPQCEFAPVDAAVWEFRAGGHQVCRKWLKDRRGRTLTGGEIVTYRRILAAIGETLTLVDSVRRLIDDYGGWECAMLG